MQWQKIIVRNGNKEIEVQVSIEKENVYRIRINDREYIVEIARKNYTVSSTPPKTIQGLAGFLVAAEIPGKVVDIFVKEGDYIKEGDVIAVLESMKMEIEIVSPKKGVVRRIFASKGSFINVGDPLIELQE
ncbi:MAG: acetyl-CoA carboxylase biotin carboxyl carrier protein subunit [Ignisphaera sp.]